MKKRSSKQGFHFGGKIKTEHTIVPGLFEKLQKLAAIEGIKSIIPGRIKPKGSSFFQSLYYSDDSNEKRVGRHSEKVKGPAKRSLL